VRWKVAKTYSGKAAIPGDKIEEYLEAMKAVEEEIELFRKQLEEMNEEFMQHLLKKFSARTARKHYQIVDLFIDFLCWNTDVRSIGEITRGIANSYFRRWYMSKVGDHSESELKTAIKKFFRFLDEEKGITNEVVLKSFRR
jgi:site-specific recombinase XerD